MRETCEVSEVLAGVFLVRRPQSALGVLLGLNTHLSGSSRRVIVVSTNPLALSRPSVWLSCYYTPQREVPPAGVRPDGSAIRSLHHKHGYARAEHRRCGDRHDGPSQA